MQIQTITVHTAKEFRSWLKKNHKKENKVAVILHKRHTGKTAPSHREMIEEAICFGWIDTTINRVDHDTFIRNFTKRNGNSRWSDNTISYAKKLLKDGKMSEEGIKFFKEGLSRPTHDHGIPKNPAMPAELKAVLAKDGEARKSFDLFPPSAKRTIFRWLLGAKLPETRNKRINKIISNAKAGKRQVF